MKENKQPVVTQNPTMAIPVVPVKKNDYVNCSKCGASLSASNTAAAYVCPVCGTLFRTRKSIRIVQEVPVQEKQIHLSFTKKAAMFIAGKNPDIHAPGGKKWTVESTEKARAKREKAFGAVLAAYLDAALYGAEQNPEVFKDNKQPTKSELRKQAKAMKKRNKLFGNIISSEMNLHNFSEGDVMLIDYANGQLVITKKEKPQETPAQ